MSLRKHQIMINSSNVAKAKPNYEKSSVIFTRN